MVLVSGRAGLGGEVTELVGKTAREGGAEVALVPKLAEVSGWTAFVGALERLWLTVGARAAGTVGPFSGVVSPLCQKTHPKPPSSAAHKSPSTQDPGEWDGGEDRPRRYRV